MPNNAEFGFTIQKYICRKFGVVPHQNAIALFDSNYNPEYIKIVSSVIDDVFRSLNRHPVKCLTCAPSESQIETLSPHNFILDDGSTLSIRTNKNGDKVAPRVVGQCGIDRFNDHFSDIAGYQITDKHQIKRIVWEKINQMFPTFLDYLFISDYTVWIFEQSDTKYGYYIFDRKSIVNISFERDNFSFTKDLYNWNESTTVKYKGRSIAEIQIHKNRTFKCRFMMNSLKEFICEEKITTETLGITAEKTICDLFNIPVPPEYSGRWSASLQKDITPTIIAAFKNLPRAKKSTGAEKGERGQNSKCSYDFLLENDSTLSLKTNTGNMVCPPEVGQPGATTFSIYFGSMIDGKKITNETFKSLVLNKVAEMMPIYVSHLLDSDYLLWIYLRKSNYHYKIFDREYAKGFIWVKEKFSFTKNSLEEWNESNTVKYDGITLGEFQVHKTRSCYKFRFNFDNLEKIINECR